MSEVIVEKLGICITYMMTVTQTYRRTNASIASISQSSEV